MKSQWGGPPGGVRRTAAQGAGACGNVLSRSDEFCYFSNFNEKGIGNPLLPHARHFTSIM